MADGNNTLVDLLGPEIIRTNGEGEYDKIDVAELSRTKKTIVLYFSAHWCPPCRGFTPTLSEAYAKYKSSKEGLRDDTDGFELVFVSSDNGAESFREYHSEMSFPALPYESRDIKNKLSEKFGVMGIPHLVAVDVSTGEEDAALTAAAGGDLRSFIVQHGPAAFPLSPSRVLQMKSETEKKQADALEKLAVSPVTVSVPPSLCLLTNGNEKKGEVTAIQLGELLEQHEFLGLVFGDGDKADATYDEIQEAAKTLGNKFIPIYVGWTSYQGQSHSALWERFYSIREEEITDEVRSLLGDVAGDVEYLMMMTIKSKGSGLCGLNGKCEPSGKPVIVSVDKGLRALRQFGPTAFPWDEAAIENAKQAKERRVIDLKARLPGFDFLKPPSTDNGNSLLVRGGGNNSEGTEELQEKEHVSVGDLLRSEDGDENESAVLGLYFSAHWCPPCRAFTPTLLEEYEEIRTKRGRKSFEVVFISFDKDEKEFDEYYSSMVTPNTKEQWLSLEYNKSRELSSDLSEVFGVKGFPSLVLLKSDGTILSDDARGSVSKYGASFYPWDDESIKRGEDELLKKEDEDVEFQRKKGGGLVVRRLLGPVGSIKYDANDRSLEFKKGFPTAILDETIVTQGVLYYEVEILEIKSRCINTQFGFARRDAFEKTNDETSFGVGDNSKSWGICGFRKQLWQNGESVPMEDPSSTCRWEIGDVIGFALNPDRRKIAISKNGIWSKEAGCGAVFEMVEAGGDDGVIYPAMTSRELKVRVNVREEDLNFLKPPEDVW